MDDPEPKVIILETKYNTAAAQRYGERVFVFPQKVPSPFDPNAIRRVAERLDFSPTVDYIALTGSSTCLAMFFAAMADRFPYDDLQLLIYDARKSEYQERTWSRGGDNGN